MTMQLLIPKFGVNSNYSYADFVKSGISVVLAKKA